MYLETIDELKAVATKNTIYVDRDGDKWGITYDPHHQLGWWWMIGPGEVNAWFEELPIWVTGRFPQLHASYSWR